MRIDINRLISAFLDLKAEIMLTSLDVGNYGNGLLNLIINKYNYILFNRAFEIFILIFVNCHMLGL